MTLIILEKSSWVLNLFNFEEKSVLILKNELIIIILERNFTADDYEFDYYLKFFGCSFLTKIKRFA